MAEAVHTETVSNRGEGSTQKTTSKGLGKRTSVKKAHETVSTQGATESTQQQTEDYGITVTFKMNVKNFLGAGRGC